MFTPLTADDPREVSGYRLRARLGVGGMGQVYLSFTPGGRAVAVKLVRREYAEDGDFRQRFAQEVRAAQRVNGVYTAQLIDAGPDAEVPWLASAYVAGPTLSAAVRAHGPLPVATVRPLLAGVALSLHAIHAADVVHRDLTPRNVLLAADGPRVIDFGIARSLDATHLTISGTPIGTPAFMSPEQANGTSLTPASDVFTLGAVGYFAATGRTAFGDGNYLSVLRRVTEARPDLTGCPPELRDLIEACLALDPAARPTTARVVQECGGQPRFGLGWLPPAVRGTVDAWDRALAAIIAEPSPPQPTAAPRLAGAAGPDPAGAAAPGTASPSGGSSRVVPGGSGAIAPGGSMLAAESGAGSAGRPGGMRRAAVAALALVVTAAAVAVGWALAPRPGSDHAGSAASQSPEATDHQPTPTTPVPATSTATQAHPAVQWSGSVRIGGNGLDLDPVPPAVDPPGWDVVDAVMRLPAPEISNGSTSMLALWTGTGRPTVQQCGELLSTLGTTAQRVAAKDVLCLRTDRDRVAMLVIQSVSSDGTVGIRATATVWDRSGGS